ncbi:MAG: hypothetical protein IIB83_04125 [Bacteroidetes bacterium]|nr:hypothetical protein [Bacteroidota bacterium]
MRVNIKTLLYVLEKYKVENCTYLDADLFFYSSPKPIFDELDGFDEKLGGGMEVKLASKEDHAGVKQKTGSGPIAKDIRTGHLPIIF